MKLLAIAGVNLRMLLRDRTNLFFVFVFPLALILVLGAAFGGSYEPRIGVVDRGGGTLSARLVDGLRGLEHVRIERVTTERAVVDGVERGRLQAGVVIPQGYDATLRDGRNATIEFVARRDQTAMRLAVAVRSVADGQAAVVRAARFAQEQSEGRDGGAGAGSFDEELAAAERISSTLPGISVRSVTTGTALFPESLGRFDLGASQELLLFVFLTSLTSSVILITARRLGIAQRMLATPTPVRTILVGEAAGRLAIALVQGVFIMVGSALIFGVNWGNLAASVTLLLVFCLVGSGAAMVTGALFRTEQQAGGIAIFLGLGLGALGGSMVPLEVFSPGMRKVAHLTPHAWANDAFAELVRHGGGIVDIAPQLGVLLGYAAVLFVIGTWSLRRTLTGREGPRLRRPADPASR